MVETGSTKLTVYRLTPAYPPTRDLPEATFVCLGGHTYRKIDASPGDQLSTLTMGGFTPSLSPRLCAWKVPRPASPRSPQGRPSADLALYVAPCGPQSFHLYDECL